VQIREQQRLEFRIVTRIDDTRRNTARAEAALDEDIADKLDIPSILDFERDLGAWDKEIRRAF